MHEPHTAEHAHPQLGFWRKYVFSTDHKIIGIQYMITAMAMAVVGGTLSMLMRYQLAWPSMLSPTMAKIMPDAFAGGVMKPEYYISLVTMHGTIMVFFLFTAVLTGGFGNFLIPLQVGARDMAFPFLNALSYWVFLLSCIVIFSALFVEGGAPLGGWTAYAPLNAIPAAGPGQGTGMTLWITAIAIQRIGPDGRSQLHHHDSHAENQRHVHDAAAVDPVVPAGYLGPRPAGFSSAAGRGHSAAIRQSWRDELLCAGRHHHEPGAADGPFRRSPALVAAFVLILRPS